MKKISYKKNGIIYLLALINLISFFNLRFFSIYNNYFMFLNLAGIVIFFIMYRRFKVKEYELILFLLLFMVYGLGTLFITGGGLGSVLMPFYSILVYWAIKKSYFNEKKIKIIAIVILLLNLYWTINSPGYFEKFLFDRENYFNSNTIGSILAFTCIYIVIFMKKLDTKGHKVLTILIYISSIWGILNTQARGSLITLLAFFMLDFLVSKKVWIKKKITIFISILIILTGFTFTYIYTIMFINGVDLPIINKSLFTGREIIWLNFYREITQNNYSLLFGLGSAADLWTGHTLNLHNSYLTIFTNFGLIGFILYFTFWIKQINNLYRFRDLSVFQIRLLLGFLCVLIYGYIEVSILWHPMFFFNFMFLGLANNEQMRVG